jgi:hypothetical protein
MNDKGQKNWLLNKLLWPLFILHPKDHITTSMSNLSILSPHPFSYSCFFFISRTDGDTSPSEPISGSTDKDPTTEATEGKILFDFLNAHELGDCDSFYTNPIWDFFSFLFNSFAAQKPLTTQRESFT